MNSALRLLCWGILGMALVSIAGCESSGSSSSSIGVSYGYGYGGYYGSYYGNPGYWYDDDRPIVVNPPENRPGRPTTLPAQQPSTRPSQQAVDATVDAVDAPVREHATGAKHVPSPVASDADTSTTLAADGAQVDLNGDVCETFVARARTSNSRSAPRRFRFGRRMRTWYIAIVAT